MSIDVYLWERNLYAEVFIMKYKRAAAALLALMLLAFAGCDTKSAPTEEGSEVEVDFTNQPSDPVSSQTISVVTAQTPSKESGENNDTESSSDTDSESTFVRREFDGEPIDVAWFDDCVFIGDSVTNGLGLYNDYMDILGNAQFITGASLGYNNCQWDLNDENAVHPMYNGSYVLLEDAAIVSGANKVIIGMGMNDIGIYGVDGSIEGVETFIEKLTNKSPDIEIYFLSVTPMIASAEYDRLNNTKIKEFDEKLEAYANSHGYRYLDTWSAVVNDNNCLPDELCEDPNDLGLHLTNEGCDIVIDYIKRNVG